MGGMSLFCFHFVFPRKPLSCLFFLFYWLFIAVVLLLLSGCYRFVWRLFSPQLWYVIVTIWPLCSASLILPYLSLLSLSGLSLGLFIVALRHSIGLRIHVCCGFSCCSFSFYVFLLLSVLLPNYRALYLLFMVK